jgi:ABC-type transporter MlaC component
MSMSIAVTLQTVPFDAVTLDRTFEDLTKREQRLTKLIDDTEAALSVANAEDWFKASVNKLVQRTMHQKLQNLRAKRSDIRTQRATVKNVLDAVVEAHIEAEVVLTKEGKA